MRKTIHTNNSITDKIKACLTVRQNVNSGHVPRLIYANSILCAVFLLLLGMGYYFQRQDLLLLLSFLKYLIIPVLGFSIYCSYKYRSINVLFPIVGALLLLWFIGFDFAYRWDAIQHVARTKFYMDHSFFDPSERHSFLYLIWESVYTIFGESEVITNLTSMIIGLTGIFGIYFIAKEVYNEFVGVLALITGLSFPVFFLLNSWAYLDMPFFTFVVFTFLFLIYYLKTKKEHFLVLSLLFAFISTGIKEPGIIIFPVIGLVLLSDKCLSKRNILYLSISIILSTVYLVTMMLSITKFSNFQSEFSTVTPIAYGFDALFLWWGSLSQEISQILFTGLLFVAILALFRQESNKILYYTVVVFEILMVIGIAFFPTTNIFAFPLIPFKNYNFYLYAFLIFMIVLCTLCALKKIVFKFDKYSLLFLSWIGIFILFFIINTKLFDYGIKNPIEVPALDFRYLIPAFPPLIILFSKGITSILDVKDRNIKTMGLLVVSFIIIINIIMSLNLAFYFANSGNAHLEGYNQAKNVSQNGIIYSQWPFNYQPEGLSYDIGRYSWVRDNMSYKSIESDAYIPGSALLISGHFSQTTSKFLNINFTQITSRSFYLDPVLPKISEVAIDSVYIGKVPDFVASLSDGFYPGENWNSVKTYWTKKDAEIRINSSKNENISFSFTGQSLSSPRTLDIYANGNFIMSANVSTSSTYITAEIPLNSGESVIQLHARENCERPYDIPKLKSSDKRCLSIAIQNITIRSS